MVCGVQSANNVNILLLIDGSVLQALQSSDLLEIETWDELETKKDVENPVKMVVNIVKIILVPEPCITGGRGGKWG